MLAGLMISSPVLAHQQKEAYTTILFNERSGNLEVSHRFYLHDAEHALGEVGVENIDLAEDEESRAAFAHYLLTHFAVKSAEQLLTLDLVGYEVEGKYFWVYQETALPQDVQSLQVFMSALQEVWPSQINHINVERRGQVSSRRLALDDSFQTIKVP